MSLFEELKRRNVLRVCAAYIAASWLIIQVVETLFPVFGLSDAGIRLVVMVLAIGFLPVILISWAFQLTPEGLKRDSDAEKVAADPGSTRLFDRAIVVTLAIGISYFAFDTFVLTPERLAEREADVVERAKAEAVSGYFNDRSIAVLPFLNLSDTPGQEYFVDGLTEELLNSLAATDGLRVISLREQNLDSAVAAALLLGEDDEALELLELLESQLHAGNAAVLFCEPEIRALAGNPRYDAMLERRGLSAE